MLIGAAAIIALAVTAFGPARAAEDASKYPNQPIRFIVPFAPGGTTDFLARIVQPKLQDVLGQPVVVENRPGAAGNIGMELASRAAPDGYTILLGDVGSITINAAIFPDMRVRPLQDFTAISVITHTPSLLVTSPKFEPKTLAALVDYVKQRPGKVSFASQGSGSQNRLAMEVFAEKAGLKMVHVPYKGGSGPAATDLMGGHVPMMFAGLPPTIGHIKAGRMNVLAVATKERHPALPDTPTFIESGFPDFVMSSWQGIFVPAATPAAVVEKLHAALVQTMADPEVRRRLNEGGLTVASPSPAESKAFIEKEAALWTGVAKAVNATAE
jgi:tripartite-type tricarboxylate transporter receptor subunit TctC